MSDDNDPTVTNGQRKPSETRTAQNHGSRENGTSGVPSAPPIPVISRGWPETGDKTDTTLLHTASKRPSKKRSSTVSSPSRGCGATSSHIPSKRTPQPSPRSPAGGRRQSSGLIVRGSTYYLRLRVPRSLAGIERRIHQPEWSQCLLRIKSHGPC